MNIFSNIYNSIAQALFNNDTTTDPFTGAEAVVQDFAERNMDLNTTEATGYLKAVQHVPVTGFFNATAEAHMTFDMGEFGEYTVALDVENELEDFMADLDVGVEDLPLLAETNAGVRFTRENGEWSIDFDTGFVDEVAA